MHIILGSNSRSMSATNRRNIKKDSKHPKQTSANVDLLFAAKHSKHSTPSTGVHPRPASTAPTDEFIYGPCTAKRYMVRHLAVWEKVNQNTPFGLDIWVKRDHIARIRLRNCLPVCSRHNSGVCRCSNNFALYFPSDSCYPQHS